MIYLEHRRHAKRDKPFPHLNHQGVQTAREVGANIGPFDLVVSSKLPRAAETATAMGFGIDAESKLLHTEPELIDAEADWDHGFGPLIQAFENSPVMQEFASKLKTEIIGFIKQLEPDSRMLLISHGGVIELSLLALLEDPSTGDLGGPLKKCEGWSLEYDGSAFLKPATYRF